MKRASEVPDIPTLAESSVPGYEAVQWFGILGPAGLPRELVNVMQDAEVRKRFASDGADRSTARRPTNSPRSSG